MNKKNWGERPENNITEETFYHSNVVIVPHGDNYMISHSVTLEIYILYSAKLQTNLQTFLQITQTPFEFEAYIF